MDLEILNRNDLPLGGFAGIKEHRLVVDPKAFGPNNSGAWSGIGSFVYLADANFLPHGETRLHPHKEVDVISVMVEGRISHEGSLEHGASLVANQVQVQRAGAEGFKHNEINPDDEENHMLQLWVLPEELGQPAGYKSYDLEPGKMTRIYGGGKNQNQTFDSKTIMEIGLLANGQIISRKGAFMAYISKGAGELNGQLVKEGDLIRGEDPVFKAEANVQIILVMTE